jgi:Flp pilus assembly protein CpaB
MKTAHILLACVVVFVLGATAGATVAWRMKSAETVNAIAQSAAAGVGTKTYVLSAVRKGDMPEATALLETSLDSDLVTLGLVPDSVLDSATKRAIARAAAYRAMYPYKSGEPLVAEAVARVLAEHAEAGAK